MISSAPTSPQVQLNFWHSFFHELLTLPEATDLLDDLHKRSVVALAEEGKLRAVNIALGNQRRDLLVWRYSVEWLGESERRRLRLPPAPAIETLLPHGRANFHLKEVSDFLRCSERHVRNLLAAPAGTGLGGPQFSQRQNRIAREHLVRFLTAREINVLQPTPTTK